MEKPTRSHETSIEIRATPAEIWKTITEAEEIIRWFAPEASVTPGEGGKMFISWGAGMESPITFLNGSQTNICEQKLRPRGLQALLWNRWRY